MAPDFSRKLLFSGARGKLGVMVPEPLMFVRNLLVSSLSRPGKQALKH